MPSGSKAIIRLVRPIKPRSRSDFSIRSSSYQRLPRLAGRVRPARPWLRHARRITACTLCNWLNILRRTPKPSGVSAIKGHTDDPSAALLDFGLFPTCENLPRASLLEPQVNQSSSVFLLMSKRSRIFSALRVTDTVDNLFRKLVAGTLTYCLVPNKVCNDLICHSNQTWTAASWSQNERYFIYVMFSVNISVKHY